MSNALEPKQDNALANAFAAALEKAKSATADIGGSVAAGEQVGVYANLQQQMSPAVVEGTATAGQWGFSDGEETIYVDSFAGWVLDIIGAPGKAAAVNPAPRKFFYNRNDNELRAKYGDGPHCGSTDGWVPDPRYRESAGIKNNGGLTDPRFSTPSLAVKTDYRGSSIAQVQRVVPVNDQTLCANCQMGQWLRPADGSTPMPPACEATYRALIYVYAITGEHAEDWEPKVVIAEGRSTAARTFYSSKRDRVFQNEHNGAALYDEGFIDKGFDEKYMVNHGGETVIFPLVAGSIFIQGKSGPYYVPKWFNTGKAFAKYLSDGTEPNDAFTKLGLAISSVRFSNGAENKGYKGYVSGLMEMLSDAIIFTSQPKPGMAEAYMDFMNETFEEYWKTTEDGQPQGRVDMRTPIDPSLLQTDNQSGTQPSATPQFGGPAPATPSTAQEAAPAPSFPKFPGTPTSQEPATDVQFEEDTPWDD